MGNQGVQSLTSVVMTDYNPVKENAQFKYLSPKGNPMSIWINRKTFRYLTGKWDKDRLGDMNLFQREFRDALLASAQRNAADWSKWFDDTANGIMKLAANTHIDRR